MRNTTLHRLYPGAAVRYETDAYSTVRPPRERSPAGDQNHLLVRRRAASPSKRRCRRERCADLRAAGYLSILILPSELAKHAKRSILFFPLLHMSLSGQHRRRNGIKSYSGSWRHSAETGAIARRSKVIAGRFYDFD